MQGRKLIPALALCAALAPSQARSQETSCLAPDLVIAMARVERPSTIVVAQHDGSEAAALLEAMKGLGSDDVPVADAVTVLASPHASTVMLIGSEEGCLRWRGELPLDEYQQADWKAFGLPV